MCEKMPPVSSPSYPYSTPLSICPSLLPPRIARIDTDIYPVRQLEWLNDTSEVVYFNKPGLDEFVILHPLHLMGAIKQIVRYSSMPMGRRE